MLIRSKRHWATLLAVGLPLVVGGCAGGMGTKGAAPTAAAPQAKASHMDALTLADRLKSEGNFSSAVAMYQQAAQANPGDVRPLLGMAESLLAMGSNADAAQAYGAALALQPNNLDALRGLGHARILLGQPQFALTQYQTALKVAPNDTRILNGLGVAQDMMGDHAAAQKIYHQVLTLDPANQSAKNNLALSMALAGDDAGAIKILEDVSKSPTATAVNRQNLALLYGVNGQMQQAAQASRADLSPDAVNRNMAAMSATGDTAKKEELLKESLGVELKGRQYAPAAKPAKPLTELAQSSSIDDQQQQPYMSATQQGAPLPLITTGQAAQTAKTQTAQAGPPPTIVVKTDGKKDGWSDWDEELVDATDVNGGAGTPAAKPQAAPSDASSQDAGAPRFLSSTTAITDDKTATTPASTTAAPSQPAASSSATSTQVAALPPATTTTTASAPEKPAASASATPAAAPEKPAASASTTPAAAPTASAPTAASATAAAPASEIKTASDMTVTAKTLDVAKIYTVQIASYRSEQEASAGWQALTAEQGDLLAKLPHAVAKADLGAEKGVFYRLQAGSFSDRKEAKALCSDLKNHSIDCMVVEATPATAASTSSRQSMLDPTNSFVIGAR
jgi:Flp pilus assembly protein TadD